MLKKIGLAIPAINRLYQHRDQLIAENARLTSEMEQMAIKLDLLANENSDLSVEREIGWPNGRSESKKMIKLGRNVTEGYYRGWGLEFGPLKRYVLESPLFKEAVELVQNRTICALEKVANLYILINYYLPKLDNGNIIEFGSYRGGTAIFMAFLSKRLNRPYKILALDTFSGMPETDPSKDLHRQGDFSDVDLNEIKNHTNKINLDNLQFIPGLFEDSFGEVAKLHAPFNLAHIDCDIFESLKFSYNSVKPFMVPGGYIVFDDPLYGSCLGAFQAVEEEVIRKDGLAAEQVYPHLVYRYPPLVEE